MKDRITIVLIFGIVALFLTALLVQLNTDELSLLNDVPSIYSDVFAIKTANAQPVPPYPVNEILLSPFDSRILGDLYINYLFGEVSDATLENGLTYFNNITLWEILIELHNEATSASTAELEDIYLDEAGDTYHGDLIGTTAGIQAVSIGISRYPEYPLDIQINDNSERMFFRSESDDTMEIVMQEGGFVGMGLKYDGTLTAPNNEFSIYSYSTSIDLVTVADTGDLNVYRNIYALDDTIYSATIDTSTATLDSMHGNATDTIQVNDHIKVNEDLIVQGTPGLRISSDGEGDLWITNNAYYDHDLGYWMRDDPYQEAFGWEFQTAGSLIGEGTLPAVTLWRATPDGGNLPIPLSLGEGGWEAAWITTYFRDFVLGGHTIEIDGAATYPYGRIFHSAVDGATVTGVVRNAYYDLAGRDTTTDESWFMGFVGEEYKVMRRPPGDEPWDDWLIIGEIGQATFTQQTNMDSIVMEANIGDRVKYYSDVYKRYIDFSTLGDMTDRYYQLGSDTNDDSFYFDGDLGNLTIEGDLTSSNSSEWDEAYNQRGSVIAGNFLSWDGSYLNVDATSTVIDNDTNNLPTTEAVYEFVKLAAGDNVVWNATNDQFDVDADPNDDVDPDELDNVFEPDTGILVRIGDDTYGTITDNSTNWTNTYNIVDASKTYWNEAYEERGSIIAGNFLSWDGTYLNVDATATVSNGDTGNLPTSDAVYDFISFAGGNNIIWNATTSQFDADVNDLVDGDELDNLFLNNGILVRTSINNYSTIADNSASWTTAYDIVSASQSYWNEAYFQRGSVIAGNFLSWDGDYLNVDATATVSNGDTSNLPTSDAVYDFISFAGGDNITWNSGTNQFDADVNDTVSGSELDSELFDSNGILVRTAENTFSTITDNSTNWTNTYNIVSASQSYWNEAYNQRGSVIAGNYLSWDGTYLNVDATATVSNGDTSNLPTSDAVYDFISFAGGNNIIWNATTSQFDADVNDTVSGSELDSELFDSNGILVRTAENTFSVITDNSTNWTNTYNIVDVSKSLWNEAYNQRGSVIAGNYLSWDGTYLNVDATAEVSNGVTDRLVTSDAVYDFISFAGGNNIIWNATTSQFDADVNDTVSGSELDSELFSSNGILVRTAENTFSVITDNSTNWTNTYNIVDASKTYWNEAYNQRGSVIAGNVLTWDGTYLNVDYEYAPTDGNGSTMVSSDGIYDFVALAGGDNITWDSGSRQFDADVNDTVSGSELDSELFDSNGILVRTAENTFSTITDNSTNWTNTYNIVDASKSLWNEAYNQRGSVIAGNVLTWDGSYINLDYEYFPTDGHGAKVVSSDGIYDFFVNAAGDNVTWDSTNNEYDVTSVPDDDELATSGSYDVAGNSISLDGSKLLYFDDTSQLSSYIGAIYDNDIINITSDAGTFIEINDDNSAGGDFQIKNNGSVVMGVSTSTLAINLYEDTVLSKDLDISGETYALGGMYIRDDSGGASPQSGMVKIYWDGSNNVLKVHDGSTTYTIGP